MIRPSEMFNYTKKGQPDSVKEGVWGEDTLPVEIMVQVIVSFTAQTPYAPFPGMICIEKFSDVVCWIAP